MWLDIHGRGVRVGEWARERVGRRLAFALGRVADRVGRVSVYLADVNGPRGGIDKQCRVVAEVLGHGPAVVELRDCDWAALIDRSCDNIGRAVARKLDRARLFAGAVEARATA